MGRRLEIRKDQEFGSLKIIVEVDRINKHRAFLCKCVCGTEKIVKLISLTTSKTASCGCLRKDPRNKSNFSHGMCKTKIYNVWSTMKARCFRTTDQKFIHYGGRGISVCAEWCQFVPFIKWALDNGYKEGLTIERVDVDGNYEPNNCIWIPQQEQTRNARSNVNYTYKNKTQCRQKWANDLGMSPSTLRSRLRRGMTFKDAVEKPIKKND